ncbi:MAG: N-6 DNA methylase, partial [Fervidicoccus fontis]
PYTRWTEISDSTRDEIRIWYENVLKRYDLHRFVAGGALPGIHIPWIIHSSKFLEEGGRLGMIISDSWLQTEYGIGFLRYLTENFKIHAIIDIASRVFQVPLIGTCIILLEKSDNEKDRDENRTVLLYLPEGERFEVNEIIDIINTARGSNISNVKSGDRKFIVRVLTQKELKSISFKPIILFFDVDYVLAFMKSSNKAVKLGDIFQPSEGNTFWSVFASLSGRGAGVGGEDFYYLNEDDVRDHNLTQYKDVFLIPLVASPDMLKYFVFEKSDWDKRRVYILIANRPHNELPPEIQRYIELGEKQIIITKGPNKGKPVSESSVAKIRARLGTQTIMGRTVRFNGWYDLGGVVEAPIYATYGAQYWARFVLARFQCALDHRILALIPREGVSFDDTELKALLAYLNSSFNQLQAEVRGRSTGLGMIELDVKPLSEFLVLDVKRLRREDVERLGSLFDKLEDEARRLGGADTPEGIYGSELARELTGKANVRPEVKGLFNTVIREIDYEIGRILGLGDSVVEDTRSLVLELAGRRLSRTGEARVDALRGSEEQAVRRARRRAERGE